MAHHFNRAGRPTGAAPGAAPGPPDVDVMPFQSPVAIKLPGQGEWSAGQAIRVGETVMIVRKVSVVVPDSIIAGAANHGIAPAEADQDYLERVHAYLTREWPEDHIEIVSPDRDSPDYQDAVKVFGLNTPTEKRAIAAVTAWYSEHYGKPAFERTPHLSAAEKLVIRDIKPENSTYLDYVKLKAELYSMSDDEAVSNTKFEDACLRLAVEKPDFLAILPESDVDYAGAVERFTAAHDASRGRRTPEVVAAEQACEDTALLVRGRFDLYSSLSESDRAMVSRDARRAAERLCADVHQARMGMSRQQEQTATL